MTSELLGRHAPDSRVAFGRGGDRTASDLLADAARIAAGLPSPSEGSHVLLVFREDRYAFAAALIAAWSTGHAVALPPNNARDAVLAVWGRPDVVAMVHDTESGKPIRVEPFAPPPEAGARRLEPALPARKHAATVFTSGTQGAMTPCPKTASQLLSEATVLANALGIGPGVALVATVQPSHIYGLLFSTLVPLLSGGAFIRETPFHAETVAAKVEEHAANVLVTVPAHLRGLAAVERGKLSSLTRVVSSTAPLPSELSEQFHEAHGTAVTEILGSTETGGIAWRERPLQETWRPLPEVTVEIDGEGVLWVKSPFVGQPGAVRTADLAEPRPDGSFIHLGRSDGVVKIGGQRVSLPAMEEWLCQQEGVDDAALAPLRREGARDVEILAAVAAPGWTAAQLRDAIGARFGASVSPRRWVLVDRLPRESNGKLLHRSLLGLFGLNADGETFRWDVDWGEPVEQRDGAQTTRRVPVHIPSTFAAFEGHFPGYPILAAAFQLDDLVLPAIRQARSELGDVRAVRRLKFLGRIVPGDWLELELAWGDGEHDVDFTIHRNGKVCSGGRISFAGPRA